MPKRRNPAALKQFDLPDDLLDRLLDQVESSEELVGEQGLLRTCSMAGRVVALARWTLGSFELQPASSTC